MTVTRWNEQEYATQAEAALRLRVSQPRISQLVASGALTARRLPRRRVVIERASLNRLLARRLEEAEQVIAAARGEGLE